MALRFLHENGFVHRSLQLDNILLTSDGHIKLIDFITSAGGIHDRYGLTKSFCGTLDFMAPEVINSWPSQPALCKRYLMESLDDIR